MYNFIAIEGCIGAGKSTLTNMLSETYQCEKLYENFEENPYLENFYENPKEQAFSLELFFMAERFKQQKKVFESLNLFNDKLVCDYAFFKSRIFAGITLKEDELQLYNMLYTIIQPQLKNPDVILYLYKNIDALKKNIAKRGRDYENNISRDYLKSLQEAYIQYFKQQSDTTVLVLDASELDFVQNKSDYALILEVLNTKYDKKLNFITA